MIEGYKILDKQNLNATTTKLVIDAPSVAKNALPGQFIILKIDETGERIPLTIADYDTAAGTVTIIFQAVGLTTTKLAKLEVGDMIEDFVGPLGKASELDGLKSACIIGGGVGCAIALPIAKYLTKNGCKVDSIIGFRNKSLVILENDFKANSNNTYVMTDDGSHGEQGFVTTKLSELIEKNNYDKVYAIGPIVMMKNVTMVASEKQLDTIVSLNPIMIDGTGMCGGCRVMVDGKNKFACVDGPEFLGKLVDFDELMKRNRYYNNEEKSHLCRLVGEKHE